jgi:dTDP-4-amino-4,6-dideoxygalactose transaminase
MKYPFVRPKIPPPESWTGYLEEVYERRYFTNFGVREQLLEERLTQRYVQGDGRATLTCNATAGLTAALIATGVRGNVVVPAFTFPATMHAIIAARCEPVLCDVDPDTWEMSAETLAAALHQRECVAIMPVRVYGFVRDYSSLIATAAAHGLEVIIDAAAAFGGGPLKCQENVSEVFSLHATKSFGIGEGGAIVAPSSRKKSLVKAINFGFNPDRTFGYGINGKMSEFQAVIGLALLDEVDGITSARRKVARQYMDFFSGYTDIRLGSEPGATPWSSFPIMLPAGIDTARVELESQSRGLQLRRYYYPTLVDGFTDGFRADSQVPVAKDLSERAICVPIYADATTSEMDEILSICRDVLALVGLHRKSELGGRT